MITCSTIAMGNQLGAQLVTLASLMHIGIVNDQQVVFWDEIKDFKRGLQFLETFDIDDIILLNRCNTAEKKVIQRYCKSFKKKDWKSQMKRIYNQRMLHKVDSLVYREIRRHYQDFLRMDAFHDSIRTDERLLNLNHDKNYDIQNGFGTYRDWEENADTIIGKLHFKESICREGDRIIDTIPEGKKRISVHLRRTDYLVMSSLNLNEEYYNQAMKHFDPKDSLFIVFSDDIEECRKMRVFSDLNVIFMDRHTAAVDMYLMSKMDGNIIANSSFSLWGALLNKDGEKTICPHDYIGKSSPEWLHLNGNYYPRKWIAI